jgi:hypothetical protein
MRGSSLVYAVCAELFLFWLDHFGKEDLMYLLFGPSMAALVVIAVIQLRDHFVASR